MDKVQEPRNSEKKKYLHVLELNLVTDNKYE
jgi:hypothetical protein